MISITDIFEYKYCVNRGYQPLMDWRYFKMDIKLRVQIQYELFGSSDFQKENMKFYRWCWEHKQKNCEETAQPIYDYSSVNISHIISKGSDRRMAIDPRNVNILIKPMHDKWEFGTKDQRSEMNIYKMNMYVIKLLKSDYNIK